MAGNTPELKIIGSINKKDTILKIQKDLDSISKSLKLTIGASSGSIASQAENDAKNVKKAYFTTWNELDRRQSEIDIKMAKSFEKAEANRRKSEEAQRKEIEKTAKETEKALQYEQSVRYKNQQLQESTSKKELQLVENYTLKIREMQNSAVKTSEALNKYRMSGTQKTELEGYLKTLKDVNPAMAKNSDELLKMKNKAEEANRGIRDLRTSVTASGKSALKFSEYLKNAFTAFGLWSVVSVTWFSAIRAIKDGVDAVTELDTALTELRKVTDLSDSEIKAFTISAQNLGKELNATTSSVITAASSFARMGFEAQQSLDLAEQAIILKNVSENMDDISDATSTLVSVLKGFQMEASSAAHVVSSLNSIGNSFAVTNENLAEGIKRTASVLSASGASFEQTLGLLTAMIEVSQNAERSSVALRTLSLRIQGLTEEGESLGTNFVAKFNKDFENIAGVSITVDGKLRNIFDIVTDLGGVWKTLTKEQQIYLATQSVGIRQSGEFINLLNNYNTAIKATDTALNSQNSALIENQKYLDSIKGKTDNFARAVENLWTNAINSESIKTLVDFGTATLDLVNNIGLLNTVIIATTTAFMLLKGVKLVDIAAGISLIAESIVGFSTVINVTVPQLALITAGLFAVSKAISYFGDTSQRHREQLENLNSTITTLKQAQSDLKVEYENGNLALKGRIDTLDKLIELEKERADLLSKTVAEDEANKAIIDSSRVVGEYREQLSRLQEIELELSENNSPALRDEYDKLSLSMNKNKADLLSNLIAMEKFADSTDDLTVSQKLWLDRLRELVGEQKKETTVVTKSIEDYKKLNQTLGVQYSSIEDLISAGSEFYQILEDIADGQELNNLQLLDLIDKYPELLNYIDENGKLIINQTQLENILWETKKQAAINEIQLNKEVAQSKIDQLEAEMNIYKEYFGMKTMMGLGAPSIQALDPFTQIKAQIETERKKLAQYSKQEILVGGLKLSDFSTSTKKEKKSDILDQFKSQQSAVDALSNSIENLNTEISRSEGDEWIDKQNQLRQLYKDQQIEAHNYAEALRALRDKGGLNAEDLEKVNEEIDNQGKLWNTNETNIYNVNKALEDYNKQLQDVIDKKLAEDIDNQTEKFEKLVDILKKDLQKELDTTEKAYDSINDSIQSQIDALDEQQNIQDQINEDLENQKKREEIIADIKQKQLDITKAQQELENIKSNRNVRMLNAEGTEFTYVADPNAVADKLEEIASLQTDLSDLNINLAEHDYDVKQKLAKRELDYKKQLLQQQIDANKLAYSKIEEDTKNKLESISESTSLELSKQQSFWSSFSSNVSSDMQSMVQNIQDAINKLSQLRAMQGSSSSGNNIISGGSGFTTPEGFAYGTFHEGTPLVGSDLTLKPNEMWAKLEKGEAVLSKESNPYSSYFRPPTTPSYTTTNNQSIDSGTNINIDTIILPNVSKPQDFASQLKNQVNLRR